ncbi:MAG TPA: DUF308 domain-containing protein [Bryobacteraceae bacterium]|nr:DUF308 domain-containing protein [Bryobacteraceae bacterium]
MLTELSRRWWVLVLNGIGAIIFGLLAVALPGVTMVATIMLYGCYCLIDGVTALMASSVRDGGKLWRRMLTMGAISVAAGLIALARPGITAVALLLVMAVWAIAHGISEIAAAIELRRVLRREWFLGLAGAVSIVLGIALVARPAEGALAVIGTIGAVAILRGFLMVALALSLRSRIHASPLGA